MSDGVFIFLCLCGTLLLMFAFLVIAVERTLPQKNNCVDLFWRGYAEECNKEVNELKEENTRLREKDRKQCETIAFLHRENDDLMLAIRAVDHARLTDEEADWIRASELCDKALLKDSSNG